MSGLLQEIKLFGDNIPWLEALREKGKEAFITQGLPTAKTEAWKYTRPRDLQTDDFVMYENEDTEECNHCSCEEEEKKDACHHREIKNIPIEGYEINFYNGKLQHNHSELPKGVFIQSLPEAIIYNDEIKHYLGKIVDINNYPFAALNTAYIEEGVFIHIDKGIKLDKPIILINHTHSCHENLYYNIRNVIVAEKDSSFEFLEVYKYSGIEKSRYFANLVNEIYIGRNAKIKHYKLQEEAFKAVHIALSQVKVKEGGEYKSFCMQKGANLARNETKVQLTEEKAKAEVNAAYLMNGWATIDTTTDIEHLSPETYSNQLVKGIVGGDAKGVFQGKIHIAPDAVKTEGHQLHKALLLSDRAEIDCKPELEIYADDVKCSHGAASGELDAEQLFYMRSRGIDEDTAKQILIEAYLEDLFSQIDNEQIREWLRVSK